MNIYFKNTKVTFMSKSEVNPMMIAERYASAIGDLSVITPIYNFVSGLVSNGIYEKIRLFYPMLGDTIAKMGVNMVNPNEMPCYFIDTASVSGNKVVFSNDLPSAPVSHGDYIDFGTMRTGVFAKFATSDYANNEVLLSTMYGNLKVAKMRGGASPNYTYIIDAHINNGNIGVSTDITSPNAEMELFAIPTNQTGSSTDVIAYFNGVKKVETIENKISEDTYKNTWHGNVGVSESVIGGTVQPYHIFRGSVSYILFADNLTESEAVTVNQLLRTFCNEVGK